MNEQALARQLAGVLGSRRLTVATAESCTGGLVAYRIVMVAGSSEYFLGGVVAYSNSLKEAFLGVPRGTLEAYGAVSRETALAMAHGIRAKCGADVGISTTGIAGPTGGTPVKPVGLVYIACVTPDEEACEEHHFSGVRLENIDSSTNVALSLAIRLLTEGTLSGHDPVPRK